MKLLIRRDLAFASAQEDDYITDITASFYRPAIDPAYHDLIAHAAQHSVFDCFILQCVRVLLDEGEYHMFIFDRSELGFFVTRAI